MVTTEEHYVEDAMDLAKRARQFEEKGKKPELTDDYKERMKKFNEELMARKAPQPKSAASAETESATE